jgi:hypothetical protein
MRSICSSLNASGAIFFLHRAAAQIWARGIPWENAIAMVQNAFDATIQVEDDNP